VAKLIHAAHAPRGRSGKAVRSALFVGGPGCKDAPRTHGPAVNGRVEGRNRTSLAKPERPAQIARFLREHSIEASICRGLFTRASTDVICRKVALRLSLNWSTSPLGKRTMKQQVTTRRAFGFAARCLFAFF